jgi:hypothetical protein
LYGNTLKGDFAYRWILKEPLIKRSGQVRTKGEDTVLRGRTTYYNGEREKLHTKSDCERFADLITFSAFSVDVSQEDTQHSLQAPAHQCKRLEYSLCAYVFKGYAEKGLVGTEVFYIHHIQKGADLSIAETMCQQIKQDGRDRRTYEREVRLLMKLKDDAEDLDYLQQFKASTKRKGLTARQKT